MNSHKNKEIENTKMQRAKKLLSGPKHKMLLSPNVKQTNKEQNRKVLVEDNILPRDHEGPCPNWHDLLLEFFDRFLMQLDELFINLRTENSLKTSEKSNTEFKLYQDICERLRLEILIAVDKTQLAQLKGSTSIEKEDFIRKIEGVNTQLSLVRWQYHNAIKDFNFRIV